MIVRTHVLMPSHKNGPMGFTLIEMLITVAVLGVVMVVLAPAFDSMLTAKKLAYDEKQRLTNQMVAGALQSYAANSTTDGRLPAPFTSATLFNAPFNPANGTQAGLDLNAALMETGVPLAEVNTDNTAASNVRAYQLVQGLTQSVPFYFRSGPVVVLTYDFGAVYMTACASTNTLCNPTPATGVPGDSVVMTAGNAVTWTTSGKDGPPQYVSSLPVQKQMLATTVQRLDKNRDTLLSYFRGLQVTAAGGSTTNFYPNQLGVGAPGSLAGATPATNQGCRDGWYNLNSGAVAVLSIVGLSAQEFGTTAWGGAIQYCRDYDPTGTSGVDVAPHYGALRINANVSLGQAPDAAVAGNNVVLTF